MSTSREVFAKYPNRVFVETGTYKGEGIEKALEAGFKIAVSIELSVDLYKAAVEKFKDNENVAIFCGDSTLMLEQLLVLIDEPVTFWLDAHWSGGETAKGPEVSPLIKELGVIGKHHIRNHTIMIDDIRDWETMFGFNVAKIKKELMKINPNYTFSTEDGFKADDILVAWVKE